MAWLSVIVAGGCSSNPLTLRVPSQSAPHSNPSDRGEQAKLTPLSAHTETACAISSPSVRLRINHGLTVPTGTGLWITNAGAPHGNFGHASVNPSITLRFQHGDEHVEHAPSTRDPHTVKVLGHCYRIIDGTAGAVLIEVSSLGDADNGPPIAPAPNEAVAAPATSSTPCTLTDSNGPLDGGERIVTGCGPKDTCVCDRAAGYGCSGHCVVENSKR